MPTLVLVGTDDILTPPAFSRQVAKPSDARLVVLPGGHGFFLEHADQFNRTLLRFLKSVRSTSRSVQRPRCAVAVAGQRVARYVIR